MKTFGLLNINENEFSKTGDFEVYKTGFENCVILKPYVFRDHRGTYTETYHKKTIDEILNINFVQDDFSISHKNVVRGFHGNYTVGKLVSCPHGKITNIIVDLNFELDKNRPSTQGKWGAITFTSSCSEMLYIPPGFGNLIISHEDNSVYWYKQTAYYEGINSQFTLKWDDPELQIPWNEFIDINHVIMSDRDKNGHTLSRLFSVWLQINY